MKITPDSSLFTALSNFPDPAQVRDAAARRQTQRNDGVDDAGKRNRDARDAVRQEVLRRQQNAKRTEDQKKASEARTNSQRFARALDGNKSTGEVSSDPSGSAAFRREVPNTDVKPKFVRLGQFVDITV